MLLSNGPLSPEHIYQEIVGYGKARKRGRCLLWVKIMDKNNMCKKKWRIELAMVKI